MKISVITINYNNKDGLRRTIESVICQMNRNYEFIIIDGESTDGSIDVIKYFKDYVTFWISEKDNGVYHAMNKGIAQAKGDYCIFMNSGDCFYNNHVLDNFSTIIHKEDIIVGKVSIDEHDNILTPPPSSSEITMYHLFSGGIPHQGAFIRTTLLKDNPYDESLKISADWVFFVQVLILDNCSITYIDDFIAKYDVHGISSNNPKLMQEEKEAFLKKTFPPRVLEDYKQMKKSECKTQSLTPLLRKNYSVDKLLFSIGKFLLKLKGEIL